jgi:DNA sulfur modification protein DndE
MEYSAAFPETVRLDASTKKHLGILKRRTGIETWNVLCRWAFCLSLADETKPRDVTDRGGSAIEMTWKTFAGEQDDVFRLLLVERCRVDYSSIDREILGRALRHHIARGTARLVGSRELATLSDLISLATHTARTQTRP